MRTYGILLADMLVLLLACPAAYTQGAPQETSVFKGWTFDVAPFYLWLPALDGTATVRGISSDVDLSVGDTLDLLFDSGKFVATGRAEARKGNGLLTLDLMYLNLEENTQTAIGAGVDLRFKQLLLEFGGGYHLGEWSLSGEGKPTVAVDVLGGGRFVHLDSGLTIENFVDVDRSQDWLEPFLGGRLRVDIIEYNSRHCRGWLRRHDRDATAYTQRRSGGGSRWGAHRGYCRQCRSGCGDRRWGWTGRWVSLRPARRIQEGSLPTGRG
jgi:hypothetical protein